MDKPRDILTMDNSKQTAMPSSKHKLLADPQSKRYFLVPEDRRLKRGTFVVYSIYGQSFAVDESDLSQCEASKQEAKEWLENQLQVVFTHAQRFGFDYMNRLKEWALAEAEARSEPPPGPDLKHPFFEALRTMFAAGKSPTAEEAERADAWARAVKATAKHAGEKPSENLEDFADPLRQLLAELDKVGEREASAARLYDLAERVKATAELAVQRIQKLARDLVGPKGSLPGVQVKTTVAPIEVMPTELIQDTPPTCAIPPKPEIPYAVVPTPVEAVPLAPTVHATAVVINATIVTPAPTTEDDDEAKLPVPEAPYGGAKVEPPLEIEGDAPISEKPPRRKEDVSGAETPPASKRPPRPSHQDPGQDKKKPDPPTPRWLPLIILVTVIVLSLGSLAIPMALLCLR
jgi:hypothetical protein